MKKALSATLVTCGLLLAASAQADGTVYRPIDVCAFGWCANTPYSHTYTIHDDASCLEEFGGGCDCNGQSACYYSDYTAGNSAGTSCPDSWFSGHWTYGINGVCHQASNNEAYYINSGSPDVMSANASIGGYGMSTAAFGNWGTDGGC